MKRSALSRKTPPKRKAFPAKPPPSRVLRDAPAEDGTTRGKPTPRRVAAKEPAVGRRAWYDFPRYGKCEVCKRWGPRDPHHVVLRSEVERRAPGLVYAIENRLLVGRYCCHPDHHQGYGVRDARLSVDQLPDAALAFAVDLFGSDERAADYFLRRYRKGAKR